MNYLDCTIIIPCYNERPEVLDKTLRSLLDALTGARLVVVDDGSTAPISCLVNGVTVLRHSVNRGQGAALQTGMSYALSQPDMAYVGHFDADGQHSADDLRTFLDELRKGEVDVISGSRFMNAVDRMAVPCRRRLLLYGGRIVNYLYTGLWLTDAHNGLRVLNRKAASNIHLHEDRMAHASELLHQVAAARLRYREMPCHVVYNDYTKNKGQGALNSLNILMDLILERFF